MDGHHEIYPILMTLCVMFVGAKVGGRLLEYLGQPAIIGELLVGVLLGPSFLALVVIPIGGELASSTPIDDAAHGLVWEVFAELGAIFLLFMVGLETGIRELLRVGKVALIVAVLGVVVPLGAGYGLMTVLGHGGDQAWFVGAALTATSVGITARVLSDLRALRTLAARIILGAAVIDDILAILVLAVVVRLAMASVPGDDGLIRALPAPGALVQDITLMIVQVLGFTFLVVVVGTWLIRRYRLHVARLPFGDAPFVLAVGLTLGLAAVAAMLEMAAIIGAFFAGIVIHDISEEYELEARLRPIYEFLVPMFFVIMGAQVHLQELFRWETLGAGLLLSVVAVAAKLVPCALGAVGADWRTRALVGTGMVPRGEVGIIVAAIALTRGVIDQTLYAVVVLMVVITTLLAPPALRWLLRGAAAPAGERTGHEEIG